MDISVIVTNFNYGKLIRRCLRSLLNQHISHDNYEIIVVDDASTDGSLDICDEFIKEIKTIKNTTNLGVGNASSIALELAKGEYFMRVDSDDYISSELVLNFAPILDHNENIDFVYGDLLRINKKGQSKERISLNTSEKVKQHGAGILFRRRSLLNAGGYNKNLRNSEDYELITKLLNLNAKGFHYPAPLYRYYESEHNLSHQLKIRSQLEIEIRKKYDV